MALSITTELQKYLVEKRKGIQFLSDGITKSLENIAGRGFYLPQGSSIKALEDLNIEVRRALSDANLKVVNEQIRLELEIAVKEYKLQIDQAQINWTLERDALLNAFAEEIAWLEHALDLREEEINSFALEVERRKSALLIAKTDLGVILEDLNKQFADVEASTVGYEILLVQAKILTNTEKLKIIPYLQELIVKEEELLVILRNTFGAEYDLIAAKNLLIAAKRDLLPYILDKASARYTLGTAQYNQAITDLKRADLLLSKIENERIKTDAIMEVGREELALSSLQKELAHLKNIVEQTRIQYQATHVYTATNADQNVAAVKRAERTLINDSEIVSAAILRDGENTAFGTGQSERTQVANIEIPADIQEILSKAYASAVRIIETGLIVSKAEVTSKLVHLIGSVS